MQLPVFVVLMTAVLCSFAVTAGGEEPHVVLPLFERLAGDGEDPNISARAGELMLGELACGACHSYEHPMAVRITPRRGPRLRDVGLRLRPEWMRRFLLDPQSAKPGAIMPALVFDASQEEKTRVVDELVHYLASKRRRDREPEHEAQKKIVGEPERGRVLYHEVGCVACHAADPSYEPDPDGAAVERPKVELPSIPLGTPRSKYADGELARFLLDPLDVRPSGRMPHMGLDSREAADVASYLDSGERRPAASGFAIDAAKAARGLIAYERLGCELCHGNGEARAAARKKKVFPRVDALVARVEHGCLATMPSSRSPRYALSDRQRDSMRAALRGLPLRSSPPSTRDRVARTMQRFNCYACHARGGRGGPERGRAIYFRPTVEADLGDEGRLAPHLDEVGRKLKSAWLRKVLAGEGVMRPYVATRMPSFGLQNIGHLVDDFSKADVRRGEKPYEVTGRNRFGRELVGMDGLRCVECHSLAGRKSLGVPALDLADIGERLEPIWFREYLLDPASKRPGTRMPAMWPGGESVFPKILGGKTSQQFDAIYVYLSEARQTRPPVGMEKKAAFELVPSTRAILLRTFMKDVGARAIAVGYPAGVHAAFDASRSRLSLLWRGRFLDAEGTWDDRFAPFESPLSKDVRAMPPGPALAKLDAPGDAWPTLASGEYVGYRLEKSGAPVFLWRTDGGRVSVEERIVPGATKGSFRRRLDLRGHGSSLLFRVAVGETREQGDDGRYVVLEDGLRIGVLGDASSRVIVRKVGGETSLVVPIRFENNRASVEVELSW
jgi:mono/diheme cytochrome c family protein